MVTDYYTVDFIYNFQMSSYPFDTQTFQAVMVPPKHEALFVQLKPGNISYLGPTDMMKYSIKSYYFKDSGGNGTLIFEIIFGRQILSEAMTAILPTLIIVIVSFSTSFYGSDHFEANVTVNLTALLVMVTLFISVFTR